MIAWNKYSLIIRGFIYIISVIFRSAKLKLYQCTVPEMLNLLIGYYVIPTHTLRSKLSLDNIFVGF